MNLHNQRNTPIIIAVTEKFEQYTSHYLLKTDLQATYRLSGFCYVDLPYTPMQKIKEIVGHHYNGQSYSLRTDLYYNIGNRVHFHAFPLVEMITIRYVAGYASVDEIPEGIKMTLLQHVAFLYENRSRINDFPMECYDEYKEIKL